MSGGRASPVAGRAPHGSPDGRLAPAPDPAVLASRLTGRDRELCRLVWEHRVLTSVQCAELVFASPVTARHRLVILTNLRVLDRFRPPWPRGEGSAPWHYVLGPAGAAVLAAVARGRVDAALAEWWSERRCAERWGQVILPDGYGRWRQAGGEVDFFLEYDRGTEDLGRLAGKLDGYAELAAASGIATPVLLWLPGPSREAAVRQAIGEPPVPVATATSGVGGPHPAG